MLGLLEKDFRLMKQTAKSLVMFLIIVVFLGINGVDTSFYVTYFVFVSVLVAISTVSYDSQDNGYSFLLTLPTDRKTYVMEKYAFSLVFGMVGLCLSAVIHFSILLVKDTPFVFLQEVKMFLPYIAVIIIFISFILPIQIKYGPEKGRVVMFSLMGMGCIGVVLGKKYLDKNPELAKNMLAFLEKVTIFRAVMGAAIVTIVIGILSYLICVRIMEKKEV